MPFSAAPMSSLLTSAVHGAFFFLVRAAGAFAATALYSRALGPEGRGRVAFGLSIVGASALIFSAGCSAAMVRASLDRRSVTPGAAVVAGTLSCLPAVAVVGAGWAGRIGAFDLASQGEVIVMMCSLVVVVLNMTVTQAAVVADHLRDVSVSAALGAVVSLGVIAASTSLGEPTSAEVLAMSMSSWGVGLVWLTLRTARRREAWVGAAKAGLGLMRVTGAVSVAAVGTLLVWRLDVSLVSSTLGFREAGLYAAATSLSEILLLCLMAARPALQTRYRAGTAELDPVLAQVVRIGLIGGGVASVMLALAARPLLTLAFGEPFAPAAPALMVLAPAVVLFALQFALFDLLVAKEAQKGAAGVALAALFVVVVGDTVLLRDHGIVVAALASAAGYTTLFVGLLVLVSRRSKIPLLQYVWLQPGDVGAIRGGVRRLLRGRAASAAG